MKISATTEKILTLLRQSQNDLSGETLCKKLGISRAAVWKHVRVLRQLGYAIDSAPHRGYFLTEVADYPYPWEISPWLKTAELGRQILYHHSLESTNTAAGEAAKLSGGEGFCVIADQQTRGRGRMQRQWFSPAGKNLYLSIILRPAIAPPAVPQISLIAALALLRTLNSTTDLAPIRIKWPNDVFVKDRKIAGILCESSSEMDRVHYVIVGFGININMSAEDFPETVAGSAASLLIAADRPVNRARLAASLLNNLEPLYRQWTDQGLSPFLMELEKASWLQGRNVVISLPRGEKKGKVTGLTNDGALRLYVPESEQEEVIYCGDVRVRTKT